MSGARNSTWIIGKQQAEADHGMVTSLHVWNAFGKALPRAKNLRAVVLEWFPEAMDEAAGRQFARDFERARSMLC
jgi:hypothetical protein